MTSLARIPEDNPLTALDPQQRLAVELYTNPLYSRTFGKKNAAAVAAGYSGATAYRVFDGNAVSRALEFLSELRREDADKVSDYLAEHAMDAALALVQQLGIDHELQTEPIPEGTWEKEPEPIILEGKQGEYLAGYDDGHLQLAKTIIQHNRAVASLAKEKREAIKLVLAYTLGSPDQHRKAQGAGGGKAMDLNDLDNEELDRLLATVRALRTQRSGEDIPEAEILDADEAPTPKDGGPVLEDVAESDQAVEQD